MTNRFARIVSYIFHPVLLPTLGVLLLFNSGFYISMLSWEAIRFVVLIIFFSTCILPLLAILGMGFFPGFNMAMEKHSERSFPLIISALSTLFGYWLMYKINAFAIFRIFMIASTLVLVLLSVVSLRWKISIHAAAIGGLTATFLALSFRTGNNPLIPILLLFLVSGIIGTARLLLGKHNLSQIIAGYAVSFLIFYLCVFYI